MAINVHKYGIGGNSVYMFRYIYASSNTVNMQIEKGNRYRSRVNSTVTKVSIEFVEKEDRKQKGGYKYKTKHKP